MSQQLQGLRGYVAERATNAPVSEPSRATRVLVGSGKGGVGTSTIAALLALLAAANGSRVLLVDGTEFGTLHLLLGAAPRHPLGALRGGGVAPEDLLVPLGPSLSLLPGGAADDAADPVSAAERRTLFRRVAALYEPYDVVVIDGGSRIESVLGLCAAGIDRLLAVTAPDRISGAATYALIKAVDGRLPGLPVTLLANRADERAATATVEQMRTAADHFLARAIDLAGTIPDDDSLRAAMTAGMTLQDAASGSPATLALMPVCDSLLAVEPRSA